VRIAFVEPLTLELDDTHVQLPICGGGKHCYPASNPRLLAVIIEKPNPNLDPNPNHNLDFDLDLDPKPKPSPSPSLNPGPELHPSPSPSPYPYPGPNPNPNPHPEQVIIGKILCFVFKPRKPPRFLLKPKFSHWRTVRRVHICARAPHGWVGGLVGGRGWWMGGWVDTAAATNLTPPTLSLPPNQGRDIYRSLSPPCV